VPALEEDGGHIRRHARREPRLAIVKYGASPNNDRIWETLTAIHSSSQQLTAQNL